MSDIPTLRFDDEDEMMYFEGKPRNFHGEATFIPDPHESHDGTGTRNHCIGLFIEHQLLQTLDVAEDGNTRTMGMGDYRRGLRGDWTELDLMYYRKATRLVYISPIIDVCLLCLMSMASWKT